MILATSLKAIEGFNCHYTELQQWWRQGYQITENNRSSVLLFIYSWKRKNIFPPFGPLLFFRLTESRKTGKTMTNPARIYNPEETSPLVLKVNYTHIVRITEGHNWNLCHGDSKDIQIFCQIVIVKNFTDLIVIMSDNSK